MAVNLDELSLGDLDKLQQDIEKRKAGLYQDTLKIALAEMRAVAEAHAVPFDEVIAQAKGKAAAKSAPKYRNPENPAETWTGRGRKPKWILAALERSADLSDYEI